MVVALARRDTVRLPRARPEETSSALPLLPKPEHLERVCEKWPDRRVETGKSVELKRKRLGTAEIPLGTSSEAGSFSRTNLDANSVH